MRRADEFFAEAYKTGLARSSGASKSCGKPVIGAICMRANVIDVARQAFDFIDEIERLAEQRQVIDRLDVELRKFGFNAWVITGLPVPGEQMRDKILLNGWHPQWTRLYLEHDFALDDPVARHCFRSLAPFEWRDAPYNPLTQPAAKAVMEGASEFRMRNGLCVPIHTMSGFQAVVSMGGEHLDLSPDAKRALHLMSIYAHAKAVDVAQPATEQQRLLTARERDILSWTAAGKSAWDISRILGISEHTVKQHLRAIQCKFNTPNKTASVVAAIRRREISL
jgi:LuxR family transcriptional regulator, quorum-sensing system regulator BjaR1